MRIASLGIVVFIACLVPSQARAQSTDKAGQEIREVIETAYVQGVFVLRDLDAVRAGFHPSFVMSVFDDGAVVAASLDMWLDRLQLDGKPSGDEVRAVFSRVDITDNTAVVKLEVHINGAHTYTDYIGLYRFPNGWKIVNKVFASHG